MKNFMNTIKVAARVISVVAGIIELSDYAKKGWTKYKTTTDSAPLLVENDSESTLENKDDVVSA